MRFMFIAPAILLSACASGEPPEPPATLVCIESECAGKDLEELEAGKEKIAGMMNVPSKAEFKDVFVSDRGVCGKATGVNALGGYPPPRQFIVTEGKAGMAPQDKPNARGFEALGSIINDSTWSSNWKKYCGTLS